MNRGRNTRKPDGFTIIELLLAMTFVSVLLLTITITVIQIGNIYNKGLTLRSVNQAGRAVTDDIRQTLSQSQPFSVDPVANSSLQLQRNPESELGDYDGGRLCTGIYTYVWNFGRSLAENVPVNTYDTEGPEIRFARVRDSGKEYCVNPDKPIRQTDATELLSSGDRDLALQSFKITQLTSDINVGQALYRIVMEIGTNDQGALTQEGGYLTTVDTTCKPPSDDESLQDFCAVNQFDFTAQAGNKGGQ